MPAGFAGLALASVTRVNPNFFAGLSANDIGQNQMNKRFHRSPTCVVFLLVHVFPFGLDDW
jgi:hypothetical protein